MTPKGPKKNRQFRSAWTTQIGATTNFEVVTKIHVIRNTRGLLFTAAERNLGAREEPQIESAKELTN
jgi:hypothetical protein